MLDHESAAWERGIQRVCGVDEAGRGPLAGPVVAAVVVFSKEIAAIYHSKDKSEQNKYFFEIKDSKKLTPEKRETLYQQMIEDERVFKAWSVIDAEKIDEINILNASYLAMQTAVEQLDPFPEHLLVDGLPMTPRFFSPLQARMTQEGIVKGDTKSLSIAAASIIAKVIRDRLMLEYHAQYPEYEFASHKGYGTKRHLQVIQEKGPCPIHRKTFAPVRELTLPGFA